MRLRSYLILACVVLVLVLAAVVLADASQARCFDFPDGRRCSTTGYTAIAGSIACAVAAIATLGRVGVALLRRT
jgi:hypothetical protein